MNSESVSKKNSQSSIVNNKSAAFRCAKHPERYAAVSVHGTNMCWECKLGPELFEHRFGPEFYQPGGPGYAGNRRKDVRRWTMDESQTAGGAG